jgi:uncharacterized membrane protein
MNDWEFRQLLVVVFGIQCTLYILIGLGSLGLDVIVIRPLVGFVYLTLIPGTLLLRVFKIHKLSNIEALLYVSGLSIATVMFVGFFANTFFPVLSIDQPISTFPLLAIMTATVVVLCTLAYVRDRDFSHPAFIDTKGLVSPPLLFLCIIPFISIAGAQLMNITGGNTISMLLLVVLAIVPLLMVFDKIPKKLYPLAIFVTALALLYQVSLVSQYMTGYDVQIEYFFASAVHTSGLWNPAIPNDYNAMLSIAMLAPIISSICNLSVAVVFKVIYQFYFALAALGLYLVYQRQTNDNAAFLSAFYFVSIFSFYAIMTQLMRQEIAELFVVLLILLIIDKKIRYVAKSSLFIIFGFSLVVSHYGLSYLYIVILVLALLVSALLSPKARRTRGILHRTTTEPRTTRGSFDEVNLNQTTTRGAISAIFVLLLIVLAFSWYAYTGSSAPLVRFSETLTHGFSSIFDIFSTQPGTIAGTAVSAYSPMREITEYLSFVAEFFIVLGFVALIRKTKEMTFTKEYFGLICANFAVVLIGLAIPLLFQYETYRAYQIALIVLAPLFAVGGVFFFQGVTRIAGLPFTRKWEKASLTALSVFLAIFLLFNSGWIYTITNDNPTQYALNSHIDAPRFSDQEVLAAQWVINSRNNSTRLYGDQYGWLLLNSYSQADINIFQPYSTFARGYDAIILFRSTNIEGRMTPQAYSSSALGYSSLNLNDTTFYQSSIINSSLIYDNGGARAFHP